MYQSLFELIHTYVYSGVEMTPDMTLTCTLIATCGSLLLICIPFFVVYMVIKFMFNTISF